MTTNLVVSSAAVNQLALDFEGNYLRVCAAIEKAKSHGSNVLLLPEMCLSGYGIEDAVFNPLVERQCKEFLSKLIPLTEKMLVAVGLPMRYKGQIFNTMAVICDRKLQGFVCKQSLAGDGVHYEPRWFKPWKQGKIASVNFQNQEVLFGDLIFEWSGVRFGFEICEEAWAAQRTGSELHKRCVDIILNPSASHFAFGKEEVRRRFVCEGSRTFDAVYLYANLLGNEAGRIIYDGAPKIAQRGEILATGDRLSFVDVNVVSQVVDVSLGRADRQGRNWATIDSYDAGTVQIHSQLDFCFNDKLLGQHNFQREQWELSKYIKHEEFSRAVALGLHDYSRKVGSRGFTVSLSGGVDSAACVVIAFLSVLMAVEQIGIEAFKERFSRHKQYQDASNIAELMKLFLYTVYQATDNSSEITENAAAKLAEAISATHYSINIQSIVDEYSSCFKEMTGIALNHQEHDIPAQNLQARGRSPIPWLISNVFGGILISTSNRSEAAVGYATMDGDTSGGLAPIAGIDKSYLMEWLRWCETDCPEGINAIHVLELVNKQKPTAELRPLEMKQTDEEDLMPYPILDQIQLLALRDKKSPEEILQFLCNWSESKDFEEIKLKDWVNKFFRLWQINQWKRERYATSFMLDDIALDPKTWCRFPVLSKFIV